MRFKTWIVRRVNRAAAVRRRPDAKSVLATFGIVCESKEIRAEAETGWCRVLGKYALMADQRVAGTDAQSGELHPRTTTGWQLLLALYSIL